MKFGKLALFVIFFILLMLCYAAYAEDLITVQASGRGSNRTEAMSSAIDDALRKNMGVLIMSREELKDDVMNDKIVQFSRGSVRDVQIISEKTENGEVLLSVNFQLDKNALRENVRTFREGGGGTLEVKTRTSLERGTSVIGSFFGEIELLDFIDAKVEDRKIDHDKGEFSVSVRILFNREKYFKHFAEPLSAILDDIILNSELDKELSDEDISEKYSAVIYIFGKDRTFKGWTMPGKFFRAMIDSLRLDSFGGKNLLKTQKRIWVNLAFIDSGGRELSLQRIPVPIPITNILFFSAQGSVIPSFWNAMGYGAANAIICAPFFGTTDNAGMNYSSFFTDERDPWEKRFIFHLPRETMLRINSIVSWLNIEK